MIDARYNIVKKLGAGAMGVVYLAEDVFLDRAVAIKVIDPVHGADPDTVARFKKEAQALAKIKHKNVVQVYSFGPHERSFYFAMEYIDGRSLEAAIDAGDTVDVASGIDVLRAVADGLGAVHALKLVHRDVKPSNIVVEKHTGRPVLIDFGLARRRSASNPRLSIAAGTPMYMAPEQAADPNGTNVTYRADIYALACTAYELFTGGPVFDGKDIFEILLGHLKHVAPPLSSRRPDLAVLDPAFARALAKKPLERHESATAFVDELAEALRTRDKHNKSDTLPPASNMRPTPNGSERVLVLARDVGVVRQMTRVTNRALAASSRGAAVEHTASAFALIGALAKAPASIVLIDEESSELQVADLVRQLRELNGGAAASILVMSRNWQAVRSTLGIVGVRDVLPKPLVLQMLAAAVERIVARRSA